MLIVPHGTPRHAFGMTRNHYIFVDYESVQDIDLALIEDRPVKVFLFIGRDQTKVSVKLMTQVHRFHDQVQMIQVQCGGKNALDFVLVHHTGLQTAADPEGYLYILSRDKGYDALVGHLERAARWAVFAEIPVLMGSGKTGHTDRLERVKMHFLKMKQGSADSRPKKRKALSAKIHEVFQKQLSDEEVQAVIWGLEEKRWVVIAGDKVSYRF